MNANLAKLYFEYSDGSGKTLTLSVSDTEDYEKCSSWDGIVHEIASALEGFGFIDVRANLLVIGGGIHHGKTLKEIHE